MDELQYPWPPRRSLRAIQQTLGKIDSDVFGGVPTPLHLCRTEMDVARSWIYVKTQDDRTPPAVYRERMRLLDRDDEVRALVAAMEQWDRLGDGRRRVGSRWHRLGRRPPQLAISCSPTTELVGLGFELDELRDALQARPKSAAQAELLDLFGVYLAVSAADQTALAADLDVTARTIRTYARRGRDAVDALNQLFSNVAVATTQIGATADRIDHLERRMSDLQERQLLLCRLLGADPVAEAEAALEQLS